MKWHVCIIQQQNDWSLDTTRILQYQSDMGSIKESKSTTCFIRACQNAVDTDTHTFFTNSTG